MSELSRSSPSDDLKKLLRSLPGNFGYTTFNEALELWKQNQVALTATDVVRYIIAEVPPSFREVGNWRFYEILNDDEECRSFLKSGL